MCRKQMLVFQIKSLSNQIRRLLERSYLVENEANLTGVQYGLLGFLGDNQDKNIFQRDVEDEFNIRRSTASAMIANLEKEGFIRRESVSEDARLKKIILTEKALETDKAARANMKKLNERLTKGISEEELDNFYKTLRKISKNAEE